MFGSECNLSTTMPKVPKTFVLPSAWAGALFWLDICVASWQSYEQLVDASIYMRILPVEVPSGGCCLASPCPFCSRGLFFTIEEE